MSDSAAGMTTSFADVQRVPRHDLAFGMVTSFDGLQRVSPVAVTYAPERDTKEAALRHVQELARVVSIKELKGIVRRVQKQEQRERDVENKKRRDAELIELEKKYASCIADFNTQLRAAAVRKGKETRTASAGIQFEWDVSAHAILSLWHNAVELFDVSEWWSEFQVVKHRNMHDSKLTDKIVFRSHDCEW